MTLTLQSLIGLLLTFGGSAIRIAALFTAKHNFTHEIAEEKKPEHVLVTEGIYKFIRHPGYAGTPPAMLSSVYASAHAFPQKAGSGGPWARR